MIPNALLRTFSRPSHLAAALLLLTASPLNAGPVAAVAEAPTEEAVSPWSTDLSFEVSELYDSNLFLQERTYLGNISSWATAVSPYVGLSYDGGDAFQFNFDYLLFAAFYHEQSSEDYWNHAFKLGMNGENDSGTSWDITAGLVYRDGNNDTPIYVDRGGLPAIGGVPVMLRRDATHAKGLMKLRQEVGRGFIRPAFNWKIDDYRTIKRDIPGHPNYTDRWETGGRLDAGIALNEKTDVFLGFWAGYQNQSLQIASPVENSNYYYRFLAGIETKPFDWLKFSFVGGPDFRDMGPNIDPRSDPSPTFFYFDTRLDITPGTSDTLSLVAHQFAQPNFCGKCLYEDKWVDAVWTHKFGDKLTSKLGFRGFGAYFLAPAVRDDWIFTYYASLGYDINKHLGLSVSYLYDDAQSMIPDRPGIEYNRHLVQFGLKAKF